MLNTQNTMRRIRRMSGDALRGLVVAGSLCAVAGGARAAAIHPAAGSAVAELHRVSATVGDVAGVVSVEPEVLLALAPRTLFFGDILAHSNNTRFVWNVPSEASASFGSLLDPGAHRKGFVEGTPLPATPLTVAALPAPGALWLLALGTMCTRRRRRA